MSNLLTRFATPIAACVLLCAAVAHAQAPLDGQLDPDFGTAGIASVAGVPAEGVTLDFAAAAVEDASGVIVLGRGNRMGDPVFVAVRLTPAGTLDPTYGSNGVATMPVPFPFGSVSYFAVTLDAVRRADGRVVVGAYTQRDTETVGLFVFALDAGGNLVTDYGPGGAPGFLDFGSFEGTSFPTFPLGSVELGPDGAVYVASRVKTAPGTALGRLTATGSLDPAFGTLGVASVNAMSHGLRIQPDGKLLLGSSDSTNAGVRRFLADGSPDTAFGTNGFAGADFQTGFDGFAAVEVDGERIFVSNSTNGDDGECGLCVARFTASGALDTTFNAQGTTPGIVRTRPGTTDGGLALHVGVAGGIGLAATILDDFIGDPGDVGAFFVQPNGRARPDFLDGVLRIDLGGETGQDQLRYSLVDSRHRLLLVGFRLSEAAFTVAAMRLDTVFRDDHED